MATRMTIGKRIGLGFVIETAFLAAVAILSYRAVGTLLIAAREMSDSHTLNTKLADVEVAHLK